MTVHRGPIPFDSKQVPQVDVWEYLLGNTDRGIPDDKTLIINAVTDEKVTFGEAREAALRLADGLRTTAGLKTGDVVLIFSPNSTMYPILVMGVQAASLSASLANPTYTAKELLHQIKDSQVSVVLAASDVLQTAIEAATEAGLSKDRIFALPGVDGKTSSTVQSYEKLMSKQLWKHESIPRGKLATTPAYFPYSSGTTGLSKGVVVSHENIVGMNEMVAHIPGFVDENTVMMSVLPFMHIYALTFCVHHMIRMGGTIVVLPRFDLQQFLDGIAKYKCTHTCIVPPIALGLARHPAVDNADLSSLKELLCGAAPLSNELQNEVSKRLNVPLFQGYGLTETSACATLNRPEFNKTGSVGQPLPGLDLRIVLPGGKDAPDGEEGEVWVKGINIVRAYHRNQKATDETFTKDGWLMTGDIGRVQDGFLYITDRLKELIKVKGKQVAPAELEALLLECDLVADAAVIGVYDESEATEWPRAYIMPSAEGKDLKDLQQAIQDFVAKRSAPHKRLKGGVIVIDAIPKSLSGKILRKDLRKLAAEEKTTKAKL